MPPVKTIVTYGIYSKLSGMPSCKHEDHKTELVLARCLNKVLDEMGAITKNSTRMENLNRLRVLRWTKVAEEISVAQMKSLLGKWQKESVKQKG